MSRFDHSNLIFKEVNILTTYSDMFTQALFIEPIHKTYIFRQYT